VLQTHLQGLLAMKTSAPGKAPGGKVTGAPIPAAPAATKGGAVAGGAAAARRKTAEGGGVDSAKGGICCPGCVFCTELQPYVFSQPTQLFQPISGPVTNLKSLLN
jgi:hypothetical protein